MADSTPYAQGIFNAVKGALGLNDDYNKINDVGPRGPSGGTGDEAPSAYQSTYTPAEANSLRKQWKANYSVYYGNVEAQQKLSYDYWIGKQKADTLDDLNGYSTVDNRIFNAVETFLPIATRANPDPLVKADSSPEGLELAKNVRNALTDWADKQKLRMTLKKGVRHWTISKLGVWKMTYNVLKDEIECTAENPRHMKFDPDGYWDDAGIFHGEWLSIDKKLSATVLVEMFPKYKDKITAQANNQMTRKLTLEEWWYRGSEVFYFVGEECLGTFKNPNWNYDGEQVRSDPETQEEIKTPIIGKNHKFGTNQPMFPFIGLSVFSTDEHPHDDTSLIIQNVPMQDLINKRLRQIDRNADSQNNGMIVSGDYYTKEQGAEVPTFLRKGGTVWQPSGDVNKGSKRDAAPQLPGDIYTQLNDARGQLDGIFGISGSTPEGIQDEETVRGKIMVSQQDGSRIGGGVTEFIEQAADTIYNFVVQFMYVYYDEPHYISAMGMNGAAEMIAIRNSDFTMDVNVTVKEGSLIPKDPLTERNEAMDLWTAQAIGLPELYSKLDFADPMESAKQTLTWQMVAAGKLPPQVLFPDFAAPQAPVNESAPGINNAQQNEEPMGQPQPDSPEAVQDQSKQLLQSVPV